MPIFYVKPLFPFTFQFAEQNKETPTLAKIMTFLSSKSATVCHEKGLPPSCTCVCSHLEQKLG